MRRQRNGARNCAGRLFGNAARPSTPTASGRERSDGRKRVPKTASQIMNVHSTSRAGARCGESCESATACGSRASRGAPSSRRTPPRWRPGQPARAAASAWARDPCRAWQRASSPAPARRSRAAAARRRARWSADTGRRRRDRRWSGSISDRRARDARARSPRPSPPGRREHGSDRVHPTIHRGHRARDGDDERHGKNRDATDLPHDASVAAMARVPPADRHRAARFIAPQCARACSIDDRRHLLRSQPSAAASGLMRSASRAMREHRCPF